MSEITNARYWWAVMYPENMIEDWEKNISRIIQHPYCYCIHDKDLRRESKEERKKHIHLIIAFPNTTTYNHALNVFSRLNAPDKCAIPNNRFEACLNISNCYDYLIHNTDDCKKLHKHRYDVSERISGNNFDIALFDQISIQEKLAIVRELKLLIHDNFICNFSEFDLLVTKKYPEYPYYSDLVTQYSATFERLTKGNYQLLIRRGENNV